MNPGSFPSAISNAGGLWRRATALCVLACVTASAGASTKPKSLGSRISAAGLSLYVSGDGQYSLHSDLLHADVFRSDVVVDTEDGAVRASTYPLHRETAARFTDQFGSGKSLTVKYSGLTSKPELELTLRLYDDGSWGDVRVRVNNTAQRPLRLHAIHVLHSTTLHLGGPDATDRVLSDSFSEDTPQMRILDLPQAERGMHLASGSQLVYNRASGKSILVAALSAERFLTAFHLGMEGAGDAAHISGWDIASRGTEEVLQKELLAYSTANHASLTVELAAGEAVSAEPVMFSVGDDYHRQLELYGSIIRTLHHARVSAATPIGWWSWTAHYLGITQGLALANAAWLAQNLREDGYTFFQIDEGYQYARGEYTTADATAFPAGMRYTSEEIRSMGLRFGIWVAPLQVSERSWVYANHPEWLVKNHAGEPIHIGKAGKVEELYVLDTTHPGAQEYLRMTYRTLVRDWGVRFIKMDFLDETAVEGVRYRPNTTALEALRIGLAVIRETVGDDVLLDKDGSPMLTPVGLVDCGRISQDTGHTFASTRDAATGIAARYYMNRNFYLADPDAFTVSRQVLPDRKSHGNTVSLTLDEAESSIALSAISGGMFEIGDDLPTLGASADRVALVRNRTLLDMARLGRASLPVDLMTYAPEDLQPSTFLLKEDQRENILTTFNWTDAPRTRVISLRAMGLSKLAYAATDVLRGGDVPVSDGSVSFTLPPHSVRMVRLVDTSSQPDPLKFSVSMPSAARAGEGLSMSASASLQQPVLQYVWDFGDGTKAEGAEQTHTFTYEGNFLVTVMALGIDGQRFTQKRSVAVAGHFPTAYRSEKQRYVGP